MEKKLEEKSHNEIRRENIFNSNKLIKNEVATGTICPCSLATKHCDLADVITIAHAYH